MSEIKNKPKQERQKKEKVFMAMRNFKNILYTLYNYRKYFFIDLVRVI